jgi:hypothetical protein
MSPRKPTELTDLVKKLRTIRRQHEQALAEIETTFASLGIGHLLEGSSRKRGAKSAAASKAKPTGRSKPTRGAGKTVGRTKGKKIAARASSKVAAKSAPKGRGKYTQTGDEFILAFLAKRGNATTTEIRQHWQKQGRKGKAENNLTGLVKTGKVLRNPTPGEAGSTYSIPSANSAAPSW